MNGIQRSRKSSVTAGRINVGDSLRGVLIAHLECVFGQALIYNCQDSLEFRTLQQLRGRMRDPLLLVLDRRLRVLGVSDRALFRLISAGRDS